MAAVALYRIVSVCSIPFISLKTSHKEWRRNAKKQRRKKLRQIHAKERNRKLIEGT